MHINVVLNSCMGPFVPYEVRSLIDRRVVLIVTGGVVTLPEIRAGGEQVNALVSVGEPPVHVIIDITKMTDYPLSPSRIFEASPFLRHPNLGYIPAYGVTNPLLNTLLQVVGLMAPFEYRVVESLPDALAFLNDSDSRIDADSIARALRSNDEPPKPAECRAAP